MIEDEFEFEDEDDFRIPVNVLCVLFPLCILLLQFFVERLLKKQRRAEVFL